MGKLLKRELPELQRCLSTQLTAPATIYLVIAQTAFSNAYFEEASD
jgi:hypothetical protein